MKKIFNLMIIATLSTIFLASCDEKVKMESEEEGFLSFVSCLTKLKYLGCRLLLRQK